MFKKSIILLIAIIGFVSCEDVNKSINESGQPESEIAQDSTGETAQVEITKFIKRDLLTAVYNLNDNEQFICHSYLINEDGKISTYLGKSLGYSIPASSSALKDEGTIEGFYRGNDKGSFVFILSDDEKKINPVYLSESTKFIIHPIRLHAVNETESKK